MRMAIALVSRTGQTRPELSRMHSKGEKAIGSDPPHREARQMRQRKQWEPRITMSIPGPAFKVRSTPKWCVASTPQRAFEPVTMNR